MVLNIGFSNQISFRDTASFSMEATASQAKSSNVVSCMAATDEIRVLKSAVIFGANASGKTNVIRIISTLVNEVLALGPYSGSQVGPLYTPFCLNETHKNEPAAIDIKFVVNNIIYDYSIKMNRDKILEETLSYFPNGHQAKLFERGSNEDGSLHMPKYPTTLQKGLRPVFSVFPNRLILSKFLIDTPHELITPAARFLANINVANIYSKNMFDKLWNDSFKWLSDTRHRSQLTELLKFADLGIYKFEIDKSTPQQDIFLYHNGDKTSGGEYTIPYSAESLGTQQLFILGTKVLQSLENGTPLFIDEMDSGFHTYLSELILDLFNNPHINKKNAQLITTTHDINLMNEDKLRRDQVWFTSKADDGASELYSLSDFEGVREDTPFARWYLANKFGAIPNIKSIENLFDE